MRQDEKQIRLANAESAEWARPPPSVLFCAVYPFLTFCLLRLGWVSVTESSLSLLFFVVVVVVVVCKSQNKADDEKGEMDTKISRAIQMVPSDPMSYNSQFHHLVLFQCFQILSNVYSYESLSHPLCRFVSHSCLSKFPFFPPSLLSLILQLQHRSSFLLSQPVIFALTK